MADRDGYGRSEYFRPVRLWICRKKPAIGHNRMHFLCTTYQNLSTCFKLIDILMSVRKNAWKMNAPALFFLHLKMLRKMPKSSAEIRMHTGVLIRSGNQGIKTMQDRHLSKLHTWLIPVRVGMRTQARGT